MRISGLGFSSRRLAEITALVLVALLCACSKSGPGKDISSSAFDSAPADIKQLWTDCLAAWKKHQYAVAATNFVVLQTKSASFPPQQAEELAKVRDTFGQEVLAASEKNAPGADEAIAVLRTVGGRR